MRNLAAGLLAAMALAGAAAAEMRVVALGDSLTHGYGLPPADGFVPQLEAWLRRNGAEDVTVVNAGVSGDTTAGGLARLEWSLGDGADALIVELGGNDLLRGIDPAASRANLEAILRKAGARGLPVLLSGLEAPGNYGPDYKRAFDAMYPELAEEYGALLDPSFLEGVQDDRSLWQSDGIHPNAEGVTVIVERIGPLVLELVEQAREDG
ncbi:arylesterase [Rubrimonas cliftonensis]|uniref:Acyl-CoA thioesterase-1 n=1 Tax=Rubrimonas cliftonensis TaxID=89524 RepID=A0A1H3Z2W1_9RHOB|nr:arylesterase [Rubrimonas cliftonensis]SEA17741.1 acyl-CoA thioesterase-1 [Rubrimonas cliftonensis]